MCDSVVLRGPSLHPKQSISSRAQVLHARHTHAHHPETSTTSNHNNTPPHTPTYNPNDHSKISSLPLHTFCWYSARMRSAAGPADTRRIAASVSPSAHPSRW